MKKYLYLITIFLISAFVSSCSEDLMDEINKDVNDPSDMSSNLIISDVMTSTAFSVTGSDLAFYSSVYIEHNVGIYNQMYNAEIRSNEPTSSTTYNNSWDAIYQNLLNLQTIRSKCNTGGSEEGNYHTLGIAQILTAYNLAILTDVMGDVPWSEALQPGIIFTPKLDSQEKIYTDILAFLDSAIVNLGMTSSFPALGNQDFLYGGNSASISKWVKFAYGLKARYTMRLSAKSPNYADVISFANQSFQSAAEQCQFDYNGSTSKSPFYMFFQDRDYFGASQSLHNKLTDRQDPRDDVFFEPYPGTGELIYAPNGTPDQAQGKYGISAISSITAPTYLLSYHEIEFLKAEAYARTNQLPQALAALNEGVKAAMAKVNIGITDSTVVYSYLNDQVKPRFEANPVSEIMIQKYIAFFEEESIEAYNDVRRLKAMGENSIKLDNPLNASNEFPLRFTYGSSDVTTNANVRSAYGDGSYVYSENVWWAGGSR